MSDSPTRSPSTRSPEFPYEEPPSSPRRYEPYPSPMLPHHTSPDLRASVSNVPLPSPYYVAPPQPQHDRSMWSYETHAEPPVPSYAYPPQTSPPAFQPTHERRSWNRRSSGVSRVEDYQRNMEGHAFGGQGSDMAWGAEGSRQPFTPSASSSTSPRLPTTTRRQDHTRAPSGQSTWSTGHHGPMQAQSPVSPQMYPPESPPRGEYSPTSTRTHPYEGPGGESHGS